VPYIYIYIYIYIQTNMINVGSISNSQIPTNIDELMSYMNIGGLILAKLIYKFVNVLGRESLLIG
jgi:hypothetical protein